MDKKTEIDNLRSKKGKKSSTAQLIKANSYGTDILVLIINDDFRLFGTYPCLAKGLNLNYFFL